MYTWVSMIDGVTRDEHRSLNGMVCRWNDDTVYSDDGGRTWRKRTGDMFVGQPGQDYNCRCTAVPFDPELDGNYEVKEGEPYVGKGEANPMKKEGLTDNDSSRRVF